MRILIAEDEPGIARALKTMLERSKYSVDLADNGRDALDYILAADYDGIVLDIMMPGLDGLEVLKRARRAGVAAPVLFLTAKGEVEDRVAGLEAGADDYLPKPFAGSEFLARVKALTRRAAAYAPSLLHLGNTTLDCNKYELSCGDKSLRLNNKEYQLMELFFRHPAQVFPAERLMDKIWGLDSESDIDVVWTYVGFLRKKLREIGADIQIRTVRGAGYSLEGERC